MDLTLLQYTHPCSSLTFHQCSWESSNTSYSAPCKNKQWLKKHNNFVYIKSVIAWYTKQAFDTRALRIRKSLIQYWERWCRVGLVWFLRVRSLVSLHCRENHMLVYFEHVTCKLEILPKLALMFFTSILSINSCKQEEHRRGVLFVNATMVSLLEFGERKCKLGRRREGDIVPWESLMIVHTKGRDLADPPAECNNLSSRGTH